MRTEKDMSDNHFLEKRTTVTREGRSAEEGDDCIAVTSEKWSLVIKICSALAIIVAFL